MPWRIKRQLWLIALALGAFVLSIIVWVRNTDVTNDILAAGLFLGGVAMILMALPENGEK